jgi:hypothetical protein
MTVTYCTKCGHQIPKVSAACPSCDSLRYTPKLSPPPPAPSAYSSPAPSGVPPSGLGGGSKWPRTGRQKLNVVFLGFGLIAALVEMLSGNPAAAIFLFGLICLLIAVGSTYTTEGKRVWGTKGYRVRVVRRYLYCLSGFLLFCLIVAQVPDEPHTSPNGPSPSYGGLPSEDHAYMSAVIPEAASESAAGIAAGRLLEQAGSDSSLLSDGGWKTSVGVQLGVLVANYDAAAQRRAPERFEQANAHYVEALRLGSEGSRYMTAWLDDPSDVSARDLGVQDFRQSKQEIDLAEQEFLALAPQK